MPTLSLSACAGMNSKGLHVAELMQLSSTNVNRYSTATPGPAVEQIVSWTLSLLICKPKPLARTTAQQPEAHQQCRAGSDPPRVWAQHMPRPKPGSAWANYQPGHRMTA